MPSKQRKKPHSPTYETKVHPAGWRTPDSRCGCPICERLRRAGVGDSQPDTAIMGWHTTTRGGDALDPDNETVELGGISYKPGTTRP
ncbi:MAG: hypothetical protein V3U86_03985, partial [Acidobacteriota bacterium]